MAFDNDLSPLTPADCDLRNFPYMPLDVVRLRDSDLAAVADAEVFRASVLAWCVSWHQAPAASLPDDDTVLARLLGYGRDVKTWAKLRTAGALHGFVKCSDGRLYHPVVAEKAREAWQAKGRQRDRTEKARKTLLSQRQSQAGPTSATEPVKKSVTETVTGSKGEERKGEDRDRDRESTAKAGAEAPAGDLLGKPDWWPKRDRYGRVLGEVTDKLMFDVGKAVLGKSAGGQITKMRKLYRGDMRAVTDLLLQADDKSDSAQWWAGVLRKAELDERTPPKHEIFPASEYRA